MYRHYSKDQNAETHERMKAANRDCNKIIAQAKKDHWVAFADSISAGKADLGSVCKKIRRMKQQCVVPDSDLQHGSTKYTTAQSKADALAKAFAEASDTDSLPADRQQFRREMEATFTHPVPDDSLAVNTPLTCTELRRALASIKKVKVSTGVDTVSYRCWKRPPSRFWRSCWISSKDAGMGAQFPRGGNTPLSSPSTNTANRGRSSAVTDPSPWHPT